MKKKLQFKTLIILSVLAIAIPVLAGGVTLVMYNKHATNISGHSGQAATFVLGNNSFITSITWSERGDNPCYWEIAGLKYESSKWVPVKKEWGKSCPRKDASAKNVRLHHPNNNSKAALGVNKLEVCTNNKQGSDYEKVKGLRIWAKKVKTDGSVVKDGSMEDDWRTNCKTWEGPVGCAKDEVATGLKLKYYDWDGKPVVRGIGLQCAKIKQAN